MSRIQLEDMKEVIDAFIVPLFDPKRSFTTVVCHTSKCENVAQGFAELVSIAFIH